MKRKEIEDAIERIMWSNPIFANGGIDLYKLGVSNYPQVYKMRDFTLEVCMLRRNQRVYIVTNNGKRKSTDGFWATLSDMPYDVIKTLYKIVKPLGK